MGRWVVKGNARVRWEIAGEYGARAPHRDPSTSDSFQEPVGTVRRMRFPLAPILQQHRVTNAAAWLCPPPGAKNAARVIRSYSSNVSNSGRTDSNYKNQPCHCSESGCRGLLWGLTSCSGWRPVHLGADGWKGFLMTFANAGERVFGSRRNQWVRRVEAAGWRQLRN